MTPCNCFLSPKIYWLNSLTFIGFHWPLNYFQDFQGFLTIGHSEGSAIVTSHIWSKKKLELLNRYVDEMNQDQAVKKNESTVSEICYEYWYTGWIANHK